MPARGPRGGAGKALREAFDVNLHSIAPIRGLITAVPVVAVFATGLAVGDPRAAITMAVGANLLAIVSLVAAPKLPLRLALLDATALGVSVVLGTLSASTPWLHTLLLVPLCFVAGMAVLFGQTQAVLGSQAIVAYVVLGRFSGSVPTALNLGLLVTLGSVVEVAALLVLRLPPTLRYQRAMVADALTGLAAYATTPAEESAMSVLASIDAAQRVLSPLSLFGRSDDRDLRSIIDQVRRSRLDFTTLAGLRTRLAEIDPTLLAEISDALGAVAEGATQLAFAVRRPDEAVAWQDSERRLRRLIDDLRARLAVGHFSRDVDAIMSQVLAHLEALGGQLRSIGNLAAREALDAPRGVWRLDVRWGGLARPHLRENLALLRDNLNTESVAFRHAVRLVVAVLAATGLAHLLDLPRGYWVAFAVAVILKPDYSTLLRRGVGRVVGTALGASLAAILVSELHPSYALSAVLIGVVATLAYSAWPASFSVAIGLVTSLVLILLSVSSANSVGTALDRLVDVVLGALISAATYVLWPSSPAHDVRQSEVALFAALARYLDEVLRFCFGENDDVSAISPSSRVAHFRFAAAEAAVARSLEEPAATRADPQVQRGLLVNGLRILRATHALRFSAERGERVATTPALTALRVTLVDALNDLDRSATSSHATTPRDAYRHAATDLSDEQAPESLASNLDEIVNAANTATHLMSAGT